LDAGRGGIGAVGDDRLAGTPDEDLQLSVSLMGQLQACLAGGLGTGITPAPKDLAAVRQNLAEADPLLRQADALVRKTNRSPQETPRFTAWARSSLAMPTTTDEYRMEHGY
jgi:hypothetical protein